MNVCAVHVPQSVAKGPAGKHECDMSLVFQPEGVCNPFFSMPFLHSVLFCMIVMCLVNPPLHNFMRVVSKLAMTNFFQRIHE